MVGYGNRFAKPENALKRAEELINVGQKPSALQALQDVIREKKHRTWSKTLEKIMLKFVELCVELRKGRVAKDGLIQYRQACQAVNVGSLEEVIRHYLELATGRAEEAKKAALAVAKEREEAASQRELLREVGDLDEGDSPESLLLSYVSMDSDSDRISREQVTPWFKFLWETYRSCLEILRNNAKLEGLYAMTSKRAFAFCQQYERPTEFRRLCEILRVHLSQLTKLRERERTEGVPPHAIRDRPDLTQQESFQIALDIRFDQLKMACEIGLWQEAFRSVEDIHGLTLLSNGLKPKPNVMAVFYAKLTQIFYKADSHMLCAYAWYKLYSQLVKTHKKSLTADDFKFLASSVVLQSLISPPYEKYRNGLGLGLMTESEADKERSVRMAAFLGFSVEEKSVADQLQQQMLSRTALLKEIVSKGLLSLTFPEVQNLYHLLEVEVAPLELAHRVMTAIEGLNKLNLKDLSVDAKFKLSPACPFQEFDLTMYSKGLHRMAALRTLKQMSQVFETVRLDTLKSAIPFLNTVELEQLIVEAIKYQLVPMTVDHRQGAMLLKTNMVENDSVKSQLLKTAKKLSQALGLIQIGGAEDFESKRAKQELLSKVSILLEGENRRLLARKTIIERRKEEAEKRAAELEREEEERRRIMERATMEAEQKRLREESLKRETERIQREMEEQEQAEAAQLLAERQKKKGQSGSHVLADGKIDKRALMEEAISDQIKAKQEMERRIQKTERHMDHLERARRIEERDLIQAQAEERAKLDEEFLVAEREKEIEAARKQHEIDLEEKRRLTRMLDDKDSFEMQVEERRREELKEMRRIQEEKAAEIRAIRKSERIMARKLAYARKLAEEQWLREKEEQEKRDREERERLRREQEKRQEELDRIAQKQRERELEMERRKQEEKSAIIGGGLGDKWKAGPSQGSRASQSPGDSWSSKKAFQRENGSQGLNGHEAQEASKSEGAHNQSRSDQPQERSGPGPRSSKPYRPPRRDEGRSSSPAAAGGGGGGGGFSSWRRDDAGPPRGRPSDRWKRADDRSDNKSRPPPSEKKMDKW